MGKGQDTRDTILLHAAKRAAVVGLEGLTIGDLARELSLSKSGLYAHFRSKEALQVEILDSVAERFTDRVIRTALRSPRGEARVRALFTGWLRWMTEEHADSGCLFVAAAAELDDRAGPVRDRLIAQQQDLAELFAGVVTTAITNGDFREDLDAEQLAFEAHGMILAYHHDARLMGDPKALDRTIAGFERLIRDARRLPQ